jgi:hypothetical protein
LRIGSSSAVIGKRLAETDRLGLAALGKPEAKTRRIMQLASQTTILKPQEDNLNLKIVNK